MLLSHLASPGKPLHQVSVSSAANSKRENSSVVVVRFHLWWSFGCGLVVIVAVFFCCGYGSSFGMVVIVVWLWLWPGCDCGSSCGVVGL